jgi:micrococcal nuclease
MGNNMSEHKYQYRAQCTNVVDGDTIDVTLDLGLHLTSTQRVRILGVNCPELHAKDHIVRYTALAAKEYTQEILTELTEVAHDTGNDWPFIITTTKSDSFGRYLATVSSVDFPEWDLGAALIANGHAVPFMVGKP